MAYQYKDYHGYRVYNDGRVWSSFRNRFLKGEMTRFGYLQYNLYINNSPKRYRAHQLVALLFLPNPSRLPMVNHIDGNKMNNYYSNLEWCTAYENNLHARETGLNNVSLSNRLRWKNMAFREKVSARMSRRMRQTGCVNGENNPRFRYRITLGNKTITRQNLAGKIEKSQSYTDALIRRAAMGEIIDLFERNKIRVTDTAGRLASTKNPIEE